MKFSRLFIDSTPEFYEDFNETWLKARTKVLTICLLLFVIMEYNFTDKLLSQY